MESITFPVPFFNNRSACYLKVGHHQGALKDATSALGLIDPDDESSRRDRLKALARRATALAQLGLLEQALGEFDAALKLAPKHEGLLADRENVRRLMVGTGEE